MRFFDFSAIKLSIKASDVHRTVEAYRLLSTKTDLPLHVGVTEAGTLTAGTVKSALGMGVFLHEGIGDTIGARVAAARGAGRLIAANRVGMDTIRFDPHLFPADAPSTIELSGEYEFPLLTISFPTKSLSVSTPATVVSSSHGPTNLSIIGEGERLAKSSPQATRCSPRSWPRLAFNDDRAALRSLRLRSPRAARTSKSSRRRFHSSTTTATTRATATGRRSTKSLRLRFDSPFQIGPC